MASSNVDSFYRVIREASKGESVRDAIINAAKSVYKISSNSGSLGGIPANGFARYEEFVKVRDEIYDNLLFDSLEDIEDDSHSISSVNLMTSGNLYMYLETKLRPFLAQIMHYEIDPLAGYETKSAIEEYIKRFSEAKDAITDAIIAKGRRVPMSAKFRDYPDIIRSITDGDPILETDKEFTENKKYDANDNKDPKYSHAWESFKVDVKNLTVDGGTLSENHKTYTPPDGKLFSKVNINIAGGAGYSGSYGRSGRSTGTGDDVAENGLLKTKSFTENGEYDAESEDAVHGWINLDVHVKMPELDSGTMFTVDFVIEKEDKTIEVLDSVKVAAYDTARYTKDTPTHPDSRYQFYRWEPAPVMVVSNMQCKAKFQIPNPVQSDEISDSWETIIANRGGPYEYGQYKTLHVGEVNGRNYGDLTFMKVYSGEDSTTSTWLTKNTIPHMAGVSGFWPESPIRTFLNGQFMEDLSAISESKLLMQNIIPVRKKTMTYYPSWIAYAKNTPVIETETVDSVWIPSIREMAGELPYDIWEKGLKLWYDGIIPEVDPTVDVIRRSKAMNPGGSGGPQLIHTFESSGADYSTAHGGITKSYTVDTLNRLELTMTYNDPSGYNKGNSYFFRSIGWWGYTNGGDGTPLPRFYAANQNEITKTGLPGNERFAIGFCL